MISRAEVLSKLPPETLEKRDRWIRLMANNAFGMGLNGAASVWDRAWIDANLPPMSAETVAKAQALRHLLRPPQPIPWWTPMCRVVITGVDRLNLCFGPGLVGERHADDRPLVTPTKFPRYNDKAIRDEWLPENRHLKRFQRWMASVGEPRLREIYHHGILSQFLVSRVTLLREVWSFGGFDRCIAARRIAGIPTPGGFAHDHGVPPASQAKVRSA